MHNYMHIYIHTNTNTYTCTYKYTYVYAYINNEKTNKQIKTTKTRIDFFRTYSVLKLIKSTNIPPGREAMLFPDKVL